MVSGRMKDRVIELVILGLDLLHTDHVWLHTLHPVEKAFAGGGAQAIDVDRYDFQSAGLALNGLAIIQHRPPI